MELAPGAEARGGIGEEIARATNGVVRLFSEYYGRGPTSAKAYLLDERFLVFVLKGTLTSVEQTLVTNGHPDLVRRVRITFQEAMSPAFREVVEEALGRKVIAYHSQYMLEPDIGFEFFALEPAAGGEPAT